MSDAHRPDTTLQPDPSPYLDTEAAAAYLGLAKATLEGWRSTGRGPAFHKFGHRCLYRRDDLHAYAESRRRRSTSDPGAAERREL